MFLDGLTKDIKLNIHEAGAWNTNPRAKPKSTDLQPGLIYKRVFADFL